MKKILSIDGGGIRGIIPATVLSEIEKQTKKPIAKTFDLIAGTSTGGIIALGLSKPDHEGKPEYAAQDLVKLYEQHGHEIFYQSFWRTLNTFNHLVEPKYTADGINRLLKHYFKDIYLKDAVTDVLVTSYEIERRDSFFFKSARAKKDKSRNFFMRDAARATSAAPTYFAPEKIPTEDLSEYFAFVDGGVFANNPAMCAYVEAKTMFPLEKDFLVVSLGTGELTKPIYYDTAKDWGLVDWAQPIISVVFDGVSDTVDYELQQLLPTEKGKQRYYRFQITLDEGNDRMDDSSPLNIRAIKLYAESLIREHKDSITSLCEELVK